LKCLRGVSLIVFFFVSIVSRAIISQDLVLDSRLEYVNNIGVEETKGRYQRNLSE